MAQTSTTNQQQSHPQGQQGKEGTQLPSRRSGSNYPLGMALSPAEFFRMNPFTLMRRMTEEIDRAFGESSRGYGRERSWVPAVEVSQREGNYVICAELPGLKPDQVKLEVTDDAIVIEGERKQQEEKAEGGVHVTERHYGRFYRAIPLPEGARTDDAKARFDNGVLEITVPVEEQRAKRREIQIQGEGSPKPGGTKAA